MGLSDQERTSRITWGLVRLNVLRRKLQKLDRSNRDEVLQEIIKLLDGCWHSFIGKESNALHWIIGSSSSQTVDADDQSLWAMAIRHNLPQMQNWYSPDGKAEFLEEKEYDSSLKSSFVDDFLIIPKLLEYSFEGNERAIVAEIYQNLEDVIYALRRYNDDYLEQRQEFSENISKLFGLCFEHLSKGDDFAKAYVLNQICLLICGNQYYYFKKEDQWDSVVKIITQLRLFHDMILPMKYGKRCRQWNALDLAKLHAKLALAKQENKNYDLERLLATIELCCGREWYDHENKELSKIVESDSSLKKHAKTIKAAIEKQKELRKNYENSNNNEQKKDIENKWREAYSKL